MIYASLICVTVSSAQQVLQVRWPTTHGSPPLPLADISPEWRPLLRAGVASFSEETVIATALTQADALGLRQDEATKLQTLFREYYRRVRQSKLFAEFPSALPYCLAERKPSEGLASVYVPATVSKQTKSIIFLHGFGGSVLAYLHYFSTVFSNHMIICPAYGISPADIPPAYVLEAFKATESRLKTKLNSPLIAGLSAGGFGACRVYTQTPSSFRGLICLAAFAPNDVGTKWNSQMTVRFLVGSKESYVADGSFRQQMLSLNPRVNKLDWKLIDQADHFFLLSHERETKDVLRVWEQP